MHAAPRRALIQWIVALVLLIAGCSAGPLTRSQQVGSGQAQVGRDLLADYGCVGCHVVPGIRAQAAYVGPPLDHWGLRSYIAGALPNNEENLVRWITDPQEVEPGTAMPDLGVSRQEATDMAAYLLSLE